MLKLGVFFVLVFAMASCKVNSKVNKPVVIDKNINKSDVMKTDYEIGVGESFQIELASNPSTGYSWKWSNQQAVSIVEHVDSKYTPTNNTPGLVGGGGTATWTFKGVKSGSDVIKLEYNQSWATTPAATTKTITVKVK